MRSYKISWLVIFLILEITTACGRRDSSAKLSKPKMAATAVEEDDESQKAEFLLKALGQKNPFRADHAIRYVAMAPDASRILKGIVWDSETPFAIIGERVVREGDYVENKKVIKIDQDAVTLEFEGQREILRLE